MVCEMARDDLHVLDVVGRGIAAWESLYVEKWPARNDRLPGTPGERVSIPTKSRRISQKERQISLTSIVSPFYSPQ